MDIVSVLESRKSKDEIKIDKANPKEKLLKRKSELIQMKVDTDRLICQTYKRDLIFDAFDIEGEIKKMEKVDVKFMEGDEKAKYGRIAIKNRIKSFVIHVYKTFDPEKYT